MHLQITMGKFGLQIWAVKAILRQHAKHFHVSLLTPCRTVATKKYCLLAGHKEIGEAIEELPKVNIIRPTHSPMKDRRLCGKW